MSANCLVIVVNGNRDLPLDLQPALSELNLHRLLVDRLKKTWSKPKMYFDRGANNPLSQLLKF